MMSSAERQEDKIEHYRADQNLAVVPVVVLEIQKMHCRWQKLCVKEGLPCAEVTIPYRTAAEESIKNYDGSVS